MATATAAAAAATAGRAAARLAEAKGLADPNIDRDQAGGLQIIARDERLADLRRDVEIAELRAYDPGSRAAANAGRSFGMVSPFRSRPISTS